MKNAMTFRSKMLVAFTLAVALAVGSLAWGVMLLTRQQFGQLERQQSDAAVAQFQHELAQRTDEVTFAVQGLADAEGTLRMAINLSQPQADPSMYANDARGLAASHQLDFLDLVGSDGVLISSAEWPARIGYKNDWVISDANWNQQRAFLSRVELQDNVELGLLAVRVLNVGAKNLYVIGGRRIDAGFLQSLPLPAGMRALLYSNLETAFVPSALTSASGPVDQPERLAPFIATLQGHPAATTIQWTSDSASAENFAAVPLTGRNGATLGAFLVGSSQRDLVTMLARIRNLALAAGVGGLLLELLLAWWLSSEITVPLARLTAGAREVAAGSWTARVNVRGRDEIGILAKEFNAMMRQLAERRELLMQTERVAAWREMAQRIANEMNEPLLQLHGTVENVARTHEQDPERFEEILIDSLKALRRETADLKSAVSQFSDFARLPAPSLRPVSVNDTVREVVKAFEPQFSSIGRPPISPDLHLDENLPAALADPDLFSRGLVNLVAHSVAAMPVGGTLTLRTALKNRVVRIEVSDTGAALISGETGRSTTQPYPTKLHGTGLGLATVQSVICDQGGRISVEWAQGSGSTFCIELPAVAGLAAPVGPHVEPTVPKSVPTPVVALQGTPEPVSAPHQAPVAIQSVPASNASAHVEPAALEPLATEPEVISELFEPTQVLSVLTLVAPTEETPDVEWAPDDPAPVVPLPSLELSPQVSPDVHQAGIAEATTEALVAEEERAPEQAKEGAVEQVEIVEEAAAVRKPTWRPFKSMFT